MSRRAAVVEEFDDDTDLPLPSIPLPNTGARGPILQGLNDDSDEDDLDTSYQAGPASPPRQQPFSGSHQWPPHDAKGGNVDITPYKTWTCVYPIYLDAKRPYGTGQRRVARAKGLWWPLSKDIADAAGRLGLGTLHENSKTHPHDWENPGRVRVQWKKDGKPVNPVIRTKKILLEMICYQLQMLKPENVPKLPYNVGTVPIPPPPSQKVTGSSPIPPPSSIPTPSTNAQKGKASSGKQKSTHSHQASDPKGDGINLPKPVKRRVPIPPDPYPPLSSRLSAYSPVIASGVLIDTVKAGMSAQAEGANPGPGANTTGGMAKGKRKVVRVRQ